LPFATVFALFPFAKELFFYPEIFCLDFSFFVKETYDLDVFIEDLLV